MNRLLRNSVGLKPILAVLLLMFLIVLTRNSTPTLSFEQEKKLMTLNSMENSSFIKMFVMKNVNFSRTISKSNSISSQYVDPLVSWRINSTFNDEQRSEKSRSWCEKQTKLLRVQDLEPSICSNLKRFEKTNDVFCEDSMKSNSCLIVSLTLADRKSSEEFLEQINEMKSCQIISFDPYRTNVSTTKMRSDWIFYRFGLTVSSDFDENSNLIRIDRFSAMIRQKSSSNYLDILLVDIDNANEWNLLDDNEIFSYLCQNVKQLIIRTRPIHSKRFQHYRIFTIKLNRCFSLLKRRSRLYFLGQNGNIESEWSLSTFSINLGIFCDQIDMAMYLLVYGQFYLVNTRI